MTTIYLVSYTPLCFNGTGRKAIKKYNLHPFLDSSIRREPNLEHDFPSITSLCRASKFAPKLKVDDIIVYITKKSNFGRMNFRRHWRLSAVLRVREIKDNHLKAAEWYKNRNYGLPSNCVVPENPPLSRELSGLSEKGEKRAVVGYGRRSQKYPKYVICEVIFKDIVNPPPLFERDLIRIFGRVPVTQEANKISYKELDELLQIAVRHKLALAGKFKRRIGKKI